MNRWIVSALALVSGGGVVTAQEAPADLRVELEVEHDDLGDQVRRVRYVVTSGSVESSTSSGLAASGGGRSLEAAHAAEVWERAQAMDLEADEVQGEPARWFEARYTLTVQAEGTRHTQSWHGQRAEDQDAFVALLRKVEALARPRREARALRYACGSHGFEMRVELVDDGEAISVSYYHRDVTGRETQWEAPLALDAFEWVGDHVEHYNLFRFTPEPSNDGPVLDYGFNQIEIQSGEEEHSAHWSQPIQNLDQAAPFIDAMQRFGS